MSEQTGWTEADSDVYRGLAPVAVPRRDEQLATIATLLPFTEEDFRVVEVGSGEGALGEVILSTHPGARLTALDGSEAMRMATADRLARFGERVEVAGFDLESAAWHRHLDGADAVVSSLVVHHLDGAGKRRLFETVATRTSARGTLLIGDLVAPATRPAHHLFESTWDEAARTQSRDVDGSDRLFETFVSTQWNIYRHPDPMDRPSGLYEQLRWLVEAGFAVVDCFWLSAAHAIYGGYKQPSPGPGVDYKTALTRAHAALNESPR